jgi:hypothetical protein
MASCPWLDLAEYSENLSNLKYIRKLSNMSSGILLKWREKCPDFLFDSETVFEDTEVKMKIVLYGYVMYVTMFEEHFMYLKMKC